MSQQGSNSNDSILNLEQLFQTLDIEQNADELNLNVTNSNEINEESSNAQKNDSTNGNLLTIDLTSDQTVYFHPPFFQLNSSPQSHNQSNFSNALGLDELNIENRRMSDSLTTNESSNEPNSLVRYFRQKDSFSKTSFEWDMYNNRNRVLKELRKDRKFIDVQLISDDGYSEYVHSSIISTLGKGLADCIFSLKENSKTPCTIVESNSFRNHIKQIRLQGISGSVLKVIVNSAYTGFIETDDKQVVWSIFELAERFAMTDLINACLTYFIFQLNTESCIKLLHLGIKFNHKLRTAAWNYIRLEFDSIVSECADFGNLTIAELSKLLEDDHLNTISGEFIVWTAINRWIMKDPFFRIKYINRLLEKLRFGRLTLIELEILIAESPLVTRMDKYLVLNSEETNQKEQNDKMPLTKSTGSTSLASEYENRKLNVISKIAQQTSTDEIKSSTFEGTGMPKLLNLIEQMISIRKNQKNQYKTDNRNLLADLTPYFVRPRVPAEMIFVIGGWQENSITNLIETYDVRTNMWLESQISFEYTRAYHGLEVLNGLLYLVGGTNGSKTLSSMHCFNPNNGKWYERANMYERRCYVNTAVLNDLIYAMGGHNGAQRLNSVEKYDYKTNQWVKSSSMNLARSDASATTFDNRIYIAGGINEDVQSTVEFYNPIDDTWTFIQPMQYQRNSLALVQHAGYLFALGGTNGNLRLNTVERYDFDTKDWTLCKPMLCCRSTFSACVLEDKIYVVGGHDQHSQIDQVEFYDIRLNCWFIAKNLKRPRSGSNLCCYRSFNVSSKFTFIHHAEQKQLLKNKKNQLKDRDKLFNLFKKKDQPVNNSGIRVIRREPPGTGINRFRRGRNLFRTNSNQQTNPSSNMLTIERRRTSTEQVDRPLSMHVPKIEYSINRRHSITPVLTRPRNTIITMDTPIDAMSGAIIDIIRARNAANDSSSPVASNQVNETQSSNNQQNTINTQIHPHQTLSTQTYPPNTNLSTSGFFPYPNQISQTGLSTTSSSTDQTDFQSVTGRIFETRSLNNQQMIDQEDPMDLDD